MSIITSRVFELVAPRKLQLREISLDVSALRDDEIIAETLYTAISPGTEVSAYQGARPLRPGNPYPRVLGYCNVARVIQCGKSVDVCQPGDAILTFQSHRTAFKCSQNDLVIRLDEGVDLKHASSAYLYHLGYHSLLTGDVRSGDFVGVLGMGTLGLSTAIMARVLGANVIGFTNQGGARSKLADLGILNYPKVEETFKEVDQYTRRTGLSVVINTSNSWKDWLFALQVVGKGGVIVNLGFPGRDEPSPDFNPLEPQYVYMKNLTIKALTPLSEFPVIEANLRVCRKRNLLYILDLVKSGSLNPEDLISSEIHFDSLENQYNRYDSRTECLFTTLVRWK